MAATVTANFLDLKKQQVIAMQAQFAHGLRRLMIQALRNPANPVGEALRQGAVAANKSAASHIQKQSKSRAWLTYIDMAAMAAELNVTLSIHMSGQNKPYCPYDAGPGAPVVHVDYKPGAWDAHGQLSVVTHNGDCGLHAFVIALHAALQQVPRAQAEPIVAKLANHVPVVTAVAPTQPAQKTAAPKAKVNSAWERKHASLFAAHSRGDRNATAELNQINEDHALALRLQFEEEQASYRGPGRR